MFALKSPMPEIRLSASEPSGGADLGELPSWDLSDLYTAPDCDEIKRDLDWLKNETAAFAADYEGKLAAQDAAGMLRVIERYEAMNGIMGRIMSYAGLRYYQNTSDGERAKFMSDMQGAITDLSNPLVFFSLEMNRIDDGVLEGLMAESAGLARYKPVIDRMRAMKPISFPTSWKNSCMIIRWSGPRHGTGCLTKPWRA